MPQAAVIVPAVIAGIGLMDQMFGSGAESRDQQGRSLDLQESLANAQLPDIQRRTGLNQELQDILMGMFENPQVPEQWLDLNGRDDTALYNSVAPGVMRNSALQKLFGLGGNVGTGGIQGFSNTANALGESRRGEFSDTVRQLVQSLLMNKQPNTPTAARFPPSSVTQPGPDFSGQKSFL